LWPASGSSGNCENSKGRAKTSEGEKQRKTFFDDDTKKESVHYLFVLLTFYVYMLCLCAIEQKKDVSVQKHDNQTKLSKACKLRNHGVSPWGWLPLLRATSPHMVMETRRGRRDYAGH